MSQLWAVYLLRFFREGPVSHIFPTDIRLYHKNIIMERSCKILAMELNQIIFNCLQTVMFILCTYDYLSIV